MDSTEFTWWRNLIRIHLRPTARFHPGLIKPDRHQKHRFFVRKIELLIHKNNSIRARRVVHSSNKELAHPTSESTINPLFFFCVPFSSLLHCAVSPPEMREKVSVSLLHRQLFTRILLYGNTSLLHFNIQNISSS